MKYVFAAAILFLVIRSEARVITVNPGESVSQAVSKAVDGDTVLIRKATYKVNNIIVTKKIAFIGDDFPVLDGEGKYQIFYISGDGITITKIHFRNSGYST